MRVQREPRGGEPRSVALADSMKPSYVVVI